jgi:hypothetical protein
VRYDPGDLVRLRSPTQYSAAITLPAPLLIVASSVVRHVAYLAEEHCPLDTSGGYSFLSDAETHYIGGSGMFVLVMYSCLPADIL